MDDTVHSSLSNKGRIAEIECLRFIAALAVFLHHMGYCSAGYRAVPFFFLLSGFFMARALSKQFQRGELPKQTLLEFLLKKVRAFYPELLISVAIGIGVLFLRTAVNHEIDLFPMKMLAAAINDIFLLRMTGIVDPDTGVCPPDWYLSSMIIGMIILIPVFKSRWSKILIPTVGASSLLFYGYLSMDTNPSRLLQWHFFIPDGTFLAIGMLSMGCIIYWIQNKLQQKIRTPRTLGIVVAFKWIYLALALVTIFYKPFLNDTLSWILWGIYLLIAFSTLSGKETGNAATVKRAMLFLGKVSLPLYLAHWHAVFLSGKIGYSLHVIDNAVVMIVIRCLLATLLTAAVMLLAKAFRMRKQIAAASQD